MCKAKHQENKNMKEILITSHIKIYTFDELPDSDQELITRAKQATTTSYAPYSHFHVGAAVRLADGTIVTGSNQENAAYPSGLCAERTALFYANARHPQQSVSCLAIAASTGGHFVKTPVSPCGACRQVMLEIEARYSHPVRILLYGTDGVYEADSAKSLLPLQFSDESMKN